MLYGTSQQFLEHFGLRELGDLPTLREINELIGITETEASRDAPAKHPDAPAESAQLAVDPDRTGAGSNLADGASDGVGIIASPAAGEQPPEAAHDPDRAGEPGPPEDPSPSQTTA